VPEIERPAWSVRSGAPRLLPGTVDRILIRKGLLRGPSAQAAIAEIREAKPVTGIDATRPCA